MAVFFVRQLSVDGVKRSSASADSSFFRQFTLSRSRRNSAVSSIGSIDRVGISEYESVVSFLEALTNATIKVLTRKVLTRKVLTRKVLTRKVLRRKVPTRKVLTRKVPTRKVLTRKVLYRKLLF